MHLGILLNQLETFFQARFIDPRELPIWAYN